MAKPARLLPSLARRRLLLAAATLAAGGARGEPAVRIGSTLVIGGALRDDNEAVWSRVVQAAGGAGARIAVFPTGSGDPEASLQEIGTQLARRGAVPLPVRVSPLLAGSDAQDVQWRRTVDSAHGVFFSGGAQARLMDSLQPGGRPGPLLQAVQALHARGGLVAGTSSGAAVLSAHAFREAPDLHAAMRGRLRDGIEVDRGFGFLRPDVVVDQHFMRRGRIGRLLPLLAQRGAAWGLGVEEDSAAQVQGERLESLGAQGVLAIDMTGARVLGTAPLALQSARLHWLAAGDRLDLTQRRATAAAQRSQRVALPVAAPPLFLPDLLGEGQLSLALRRLALGTTTELLGLTFPAPPGDDGPAFEWRLRADRDTEAWRGADGSASLFGLRLDVQPVRMARPLYTPWPGSSGAS